MVTNPENRSADDTTTPTRGRGGTSPRYVDLPFWVDAFLHLDPPRRPDGQVRDAARWRIYPVIRALLADRIDVRGDEAVQLNRDKLAKWGGFGHARNCGWLFQYLERIGFLEVQHHPSSSGQGFDTFDVFTDPPDNYIGPTTYAELDMAIAAGVRYPLLSDEHRTPWAAPNSAHEEAGADPTSAHAEVGTKNPWAAPNSAHEEAGADPTSAHAEVGTKNPWAAPNSAHAEPRARGIRREGKDPSGSFPEPNEPTAGTPAAGAAAGDPLEEHPELLELVLKLDWGKRDDISYEEARKVVSAMAYAQHQLGWGHERITSEAINAIKHASSNPFSFVAGRFRQGDRLGRLQLAPKDQRLAAAEGAEQQPQGNEQQPQGNEQQAGRQHAADESAPATPSSPFDRVTGEQLPPWCGKCNQGKRQAERDKTLRTTDGRPCSRCHPDASSEAEEQPREESSPALTEEFRLEMRREARRARRRRTGW